MATSISCLSELNPLLLVARTMLLQSTNWIHTTLGLLGLDSSSTNSSSIGVALTDCAMLFDESEPRLTRLLSGENDTGDDARTWLSGVLANHRTCLDGLGEKGFVEPHLASINLTTLVGQALALYGNHMNMEGFKSKRREIALKVLFYFELPYNTIYFGNNYWNTPGTEISPQPKWGLLASWNGETSKAHFGVAKDGSGTHVTINEVVVALHRMGHKTIVTGNRNVPDGSTTLSSVTFGVLGDGFWARDMTFQNTPGPEKHQAVALRVSSDLSVLYRCSFKAYQHTLYAHSLRQFYRDCHIYGVPKISSSAMPRDASETTGIVIHGSRIRTALEFSAVKGTFRSYLGRPWKKYSRTIVLKTDKDSLVHPTGWTERRGSYALSRLFYGEYMNTGIGAKPKQRVKWPGFHVIGRQEQASPFSVSNFIQGGSWILATGVPVWLGV
ncbi:hypothetical protein FNV43_RR18286 [Rhamnella rubrinervis]|uniref:Pectinesterase inhibitor domain-containing protein n=1 Tax=Rhamnella rubrinervis TaxID=2594499 RepID=A0A8K0GWC1_9ROSA|nr:hypothetical protein FNV43_RR18286 [Rhamnella rubrinervis]